MKAVVITVMFAIAIVQAIELNKILHEECSKQEKLSSEELTMLPEPGLTENVPQNIKCFHKCIMEKIGYFKDGKLVEDKILGDWSKNPKKEQMDGWFHSCREGKAADPCETAYTYLICMMKQSKA